MSSITNLSRQSQTAVDDKVNDDLDQMRQQAQNRSKKPDAKSTKQQVDTLTADVQRAAAAKTISPEAATSALAQGAMLAEKANAAGNDASNNSLSDTFKTWCAVTGKEATPATFTQYLENFGQAGKADPQFVAAAQTQFSAMFPAQAGSTSSQAMPQTAAASDMPQLGQNTPSPATGPAMAAAAGVATPGQPAQDAAVNVPLPAGADVSVDGLSWEAILAMSQEAAKPGDKLEKKEDDKQELRRFATARQHAAQLAAQDRDPMAGGAPKVASAVMSAALSTVSGAASAAANGGAKTISKGGTFAAAEDRQTRAQEGGAASLSGTAARHALPNQLSQPVQAVTERQHSGSGGEGHSDSSSESERQTNADSGGSYE